MFSGRADARANGASATFRRCFTFFGICMFCHNDDSWLRRISAVRVSATLVIGTLAMLQLACSSRVERETTQQSADGTIGDTMAGVDSAARDRNGAMTMPAREQQDVLNQLAMLGGKPMETLTPAEARLQPTPGDAVAALLKKNGGSTLPEAVASVVDRTILGAAGSVPARIYTPAGSGPFPLVVYFHGGGFVIATMDTYDASARALANATGAIVVSVQYRKAPEHKFPAAHDDALAAYAWVVKNGAELNGNVARVAVAGESAGGNLALATAIGAREKQLPLPVAILAVYPIAGTDTDTPSYEAQANAKPLNRPMMQWFFSHYMRTPADAQDVRLNLMAADLAGLPPTTIITAQFDPLHSDGTMLASRLEAAGVSVRLRHFEGVAHEFFGQGAIVPAAKEAVAYAAEGLRSGLERR